MKEPYSGRVLKGLHDLVLAHKYIATAYSPQHALKHGHPLTLCHPSYETGKKIMNKFHVNSNPVSSKTVKPVQ